MLHVVELDIRHHGDLGRMQGQGAIAFIGLHHGEGAGAGARHAAERLDFAANAERWGEPGGGQDLGDEGGGGGLAVCPGDGDGGRVGQ